jgi:hypothetical protein
VTNVIPRKVTPDTGRTSYGGSLLSPTKPQLDGKGVNQVATKKVSPKKPASGDSTKGKKSAATRVSRVQRVQRVKRVKRVKR